MYRNNAVYYAIPFTAKRNKTITPAGHIAKNDDVTERRPEMPKAVRNLLLERVDGVVVGHKINK